MDVRSGATFWIVGGRVASDSTLRRGGFPFKILSKVFNYDHGEVAANPVHLLWYKNHWEANYILEGEADVVDIGTLHTHPLAPGTLYVVGPDDRHSVRTHTELHLISIFNPPLVGDEQHDEDGTLPASGPCRPDHPHELAPPPGSDPLFPTIQDTGVSPMAAWQVLQGGILGSPSPARRRSTHGIQARRRHGPVWPRSVLPTRGFGVIMTGEHNVVRS